MTSKHWLLPWQRPWTPSRLLSRKLMLATVVIAVALVADLTGRALQPATLSFVRDLVMGYLAVQGAVDYRAVKVQTDWLEQLKHKTDSV